MSVHHVDVSGLHPVPDVLSHAVVAVDAGLVHLSGQVAWDADGEVVGRGDHGRQARQIVANIETALAAVGSDRSQVVKETIYVVGLRPEVADPVLAALRTGRTGPPPAQTIVGVAALYSPDFLVEIDIVAACPPPSPHPETPVR